MLSHYAMFDAKEIERLILVGIPKCQVEVHDLTGTADHFEVDVVSSAFSGKSLIEQHRMVYAALGDVVGGPIHALKIKTQTPR